MCVCVRACMHVKSLKKKTVPDYEGIRSNMVSFSSEWAGGV